MKPRTFTDTEMQFMKILWAQGEATPDEIAADLEISGKKPAYGTIRNMLVLMIDKGFVARRKDGKVYHYRALVEEQTAKKTMLEHILGKVFDGSESSMVATLLSGKDISRDEIDEIHRLVEEEKAREGE